LVGVGDVLADVVLDDLGDETVEGATRGRQREQHCGTLVGLIEPLLDGAELSLDATHSLEELVPIPGRMAHAYTLPGYGPGRKALTAAASRIIRRNGTAGALVRRGVRANTGHCPETTRVAKG